MDGLLALVYHPIPLLLLAKLRLHLYNLEHVLVGNPLLVVGLVSMLPNIALVVCLVQALCTCKPIHHGDDGLRGRSVVGQWNGGMLVRQWERVNELVDLPAQVNGGAMLVVQMSGHGEWHQHVLAFLANQHVVLAV